jgi:hypothetical protein
MRCNVGFLCRNGRFWTDDEKRQGASTGPARPVDGSRASGL